MTGISHPWNVTPEQAIALQLQYAPYLDTQTPIDLSKVKRVAGVDVSVKNEISRAAIVIMSFPELAVIDAVTYEKPTPFPYIPGLLTFREGEVILGAHAQLTELPDVYIFDGMGIIHPRKMGIAAHMGLWLDAPTVGCGKSHLLGKYVAPDRERGSFSPLTYRGEQLGIVLRTREGVAPVYISPGNHATIDSAKELILACTTRYRLPDPIRAAHKLAGQPS
jgi:deoxyribonuclease V